MREAGEFKQQEINFYPEQLLKEIELVVLRSEDDHPRVQKRIEITKEIIGERVSGFTEIWGEGKSLLARMFSLTYLGDYTSVYLALLYGIDPSPVHLSNPCKKCAKRQCA